VLFLCSGNYFRSRFAELLFNQLAVESALPVRATSAGLEERCHTRNVGPISPHTVAGLRARGIPVSSPRAPLDVTAEDLDRADLIIAVKEAEHRPRLAARFPAWTDRVRYWHVDDIDLASPPDALARLEALVRALVVELGDTTAQWR
jgi:protein-tyrosine phosphatase